MSPELLRAAASAVLYLHFAVVVFNLFWMLAIPLGAWRGWTFVRSFWWRAAHVIVLALVALQAAIGALCFLTDLAEFSPARGRRSGGDIADQRDRDAPHLLAPSALGRGVRGIYVAAFAYTIAMWWLVPPYRRPG